MIAGLICKMTSYRVLSAEVLRRRLQYDFVDQIRKQINLSTMLATLVWHQVWQPISIQVFVEIREPLQTAWDTSLAKEMRR